MDTRNQIEKRTPSLEDFYGYALISDFYYAEEALYFIEERALNRNHERIHRLCRLKKADDEAERLAEGKFRKILHGNKDSLLLLSETKDGFELLEYREKMGMRTLAFQLDRRASDLCYSEKIGLLYTAPAEAHLGKRDTDNSNFGSIFFETSSKARPNRKHLHVQYVQNNELKSTDLLKNRDGEVESFSLSPKHTKVAYLYRDFLAEKTQNAIYLYNFENKKTFHLRSAKETEEISELAFFDEDLLFYTVKQNRYPHKAPTPFLLDLKEKKLLRLKEQDGKFSAKILSDGNFLYFLRAIDESVRLFRMDKKGGLTQISRAEKNVLDFSLCKDALYTVATEGPSLPELYRIDLNMRREERWSKCNQEFIRSQKIAMPLPFSFTNKENIEIRGFLFLPPSEERKVLPLIIELNEGPGHLFTSAYTDRTQFFCSKGFACLLLNLRGSDGRGSLFADLQGNLGFKDYRDLTEASDEVLKQYPVLDKNKIFLLGEGYGGFLTNWAITHGTKYTAACSINGFSNCLSKKLCVSREGEDGLPELDANPFDEIEVFELHSPINYVKSCKTPTLFLHEKGRKDLLQTESLAMYRGLKRNGCRAELRFIEEGDSPWSRLAKLKAILAWFESFLQEPLS